MVKGSPEAKRWGEKMQSIRSAGLRTEKKFFGPRGVFAKEEHVKHQRTSRNPVHDPSFQAGHDFAKWLTEQGESIHTIDPSSPIPPLEKKFLQSEGITPHARLYWKGFNVFVQHRPRSARSNPITVVGNPKPILSCPQCGVTVLLPSAAVRLTGRISCRNGHTFQYEAMKYYNRDGGLKKAYLGNPIKENHPARINTTIAGVLYNRCREIRAEKTSKTSLAGLYYHPFLERSKVCVLALDNGDILIHSQAGEKLWKLD